MLACVYIGVSVCLFVAVNGYAAGSGGHDISQFNEEPNPAQAQVDCGQTFFADQTGVISSPNVTFAFTGFITCYYMIKADAGRTIDILIQDLNTTYSTDCETSSYLKIVDLQTSQCLCPDDIPCMDGKMCGGPYEPITDPFEVTSTGNSVMLQFRRDSSGGQSFRVSYSVRYAPVPEGGTYRDLHKALHANFTTALPMGPNNEPVVIDLRLSLKHILEVNTANKRVSLVVWKEESWVDPTLAWSLDDFPIPSVGIRAIDLWFPDVIPYNLLSKNEFLTPQTVNIQHTGRVVSVQAIKLSVDCETDGYNTYSGSACALSMGSWTYNANLMTFAEPTTRSFDIADFSESSKFEIMEDTNIAVKEQHYLPCCPEPYDTVLFKFCFRMKGYHVES